MRTHRLYLYVPKIDIKDVLLFPAMKPIETGPGTHVPGAGPPGQ